MIAQVTFFFTFLLPSLGNSHSLKTTTAAHCPDPMEIGELRVMYTNLCLDVSGESGSGNAQLFECNGQANQIVVLCNDGTVRNLKESFCLQTENDNGEDSVVSGGCELWTDIPDHVRWRTVRVKSFQDASMVDQKSFAIENVKSGLCLDISGGEKSDKSKNVFTTDCAERSSQRLFVYNRGKIVRHGRLRNWKSRQCIDGSGDGEGDKKGNLVITPCRKDASHFWKFYENGEIINEKFRECIAIGSPSSDIKGANNVVRYQCNNKIDQHWLAPLCGDGTATNACSFVNAMSSKCLDISGDQAVGNLVSYKCEYITDQLFGWVPSVWAVPTLDWDWVECFVNNSMSKQSITNTVQFPDAVTVPMSSEVAIAIESEMEFIASDVSQTVSAMVARSMAHHWTNSYNPSKQTSQMTSWVSCDRYGNGKVFMDGCMWRAMVKVKNTKRDETLSWTPVIIRCTKKKIKPVCPPFTKCLDRDCTACLHTVDNTHKKSKVMNYRAARRRHHGHDLRKRT